ncbi:methyltransferase [bacterium SCSIO 12741]|nr:methyltransferase [bacterium SCSIO 12741]
MATRPFRFKQFSIHQDQAPFKVGTDGALLGAWAAVQNEHRILDIGTGTGLIALMLKQRAPKAQVVALEYQKEAADQARINFEESPWDIGLVEQDLQSFIPQSNFDRIVCNPPYFKPSTLSDNKGKNLSRQNLSLDLDDLFRFADQHLSASGQLSMVIPKDRENDYRKWMDQFNFHPLREWSMHPTPVHEVKRMLLTCGRVAQETEVKSFILESEGRHHYSLEVKELLRDFYLFL